MIIAITVIFVFGYLCIALEHPLRINKASTALLIAVAIWTAYMIAAPGIVPGTEAFTHFVESSPGMAEHSLREQVYSFVQQEQIIDVLGEIAETLFFLLGAMTIVELIDVNGGFEFITNRITTRRKKKLLWIIGLITFFMSATLDNLTTSIVMVALLRKIIHNYKERWIFASIIIIAANSGGAWSPIGDITTIMLWVRGNITTAGVMVNLFIPCLVSFLIPALILQRYLHGEVTAAPDHLRVVSVHDGQVSYQTGISKKARLSILLLGVGCLVFVPVFKTITHLPPFMGILGGLGIMWLYTEIMYKHKPGLPEQYKHRLPEVLRKIDTPTILFFLGILLAVSGLQAAGILGNLSLWLDEKIHNVYIIDLMVGVLSAIVDNVPLVAGAIATYPLANPAMLAMTPDPAYAAHFIQDGAFWEFLAYCAGVGGSMLIIGSAAGVVIMGLEKIRFGWYLKNISLAALAGYAAGAAVYILTNMLWV